MGNETLLNKALLVSKYAITKSALKPLDTNSKLITNSLNERYELRYLLNKNLVYNNFIGPKLNPFHPWDRNLEVSTILSDHHLILNKYPVQLGHMLLITNEWKPQTGWLEINDFHALINVNEDTSGLWFYNSGRKAGASQPHRHIQLLPRGTNMEICPMDSWFVNRLNSASHSQEYFLDESSILHSFKDELSDLSAYNLYSKYLEMCNKLRIGNPSKDSQPLISYNLLITNKWIYLVRRSKESAYGFSINSLGFAGFLLSTEYSDVKWLKKYGIKKLLEEVTDRI